MICKGATNKYITPAGLKVIFNNPVTFGSTVTLHQNPVAALQAATKQYVDNAISFVPVLDNTINVSGSTSVGKAINISTSGTYSYSGLSYFSILEIIPNFTFKTNSTGTNSKELSILLQNSISPNTFTQILRFYSTGTETVTIGQDNAIVIPLITETVYSDRKDILFMYNSQYPFRMSLYMDSKRSSNNLYLGISPMDGNFIYTLNGTIRCKILGIKFKS